MKKKYPVGTILTLDAGGTTFSFSSVDSRGEPSLPVVIDTDAKQLQESGEVSLLKKGRSMK